MMHDLKVDPKVFTDLVRRTKTFELRKDDRNFQVGDILKLQETRYSSEEMQAGKPLEYTKKFVLAGVSHIIRGPKYGLAEGWAILSIQYAHEEPRILNVDKNKT